MEAECSPISKTIGHGPDDFNTTESQITPFVSS
jgi:hypothetical protein